jgi:hypothetical protein
VFFPVPRFVKDYWDYPEVRKARSFLIYGVNRDSPEEKILDFYDKMEQVCMHALNTLQRMHANNTYCSAECAARIINAVVVLYSTSVYVLTH